MAFHVKWFEEEIPDEDDGNAGGVSLMTSKKVRAPSKGDLYRAASSGFVDSFL